MINAIRPALLACLAAVLFLVSACTTVSFDKTGPQQLDTWVMQHRYGKALKWISEVDESNPQFNQYQARKRDIEAQARQYEQQVIETAGREIGANRWSEASAVYHQALEKYPESTVLQQASVDFAAHRKLNNRDIACKAAVSRGRAAMAELPWRSRQAAGDPNDLTAQWELKRLNDEISSLRNKLTDCARQTILTQSHELSLACISQAKAMNPTVDETRYLQSLEKRIHDHRKQQSIAVQHSEETRSKAAELKNRLHEQIRTDKLLEARVTLARLKKLVPDSADIPRLEKKLASAIDLRVKQKIDHGTRLYRQEKVAQARSIWQEALRLDPHNQEVMALISRADRVLDKIDSLKKEQ